MLQEILKDLQSSLKSYNQGLAKQNMLVEIPWTMVDGDLNIQRLIFRKDNTLYIVKEGEIQESKWEYLAAMNSLVIEIGGKKTLLNEIYADGKALILKKDGTSMEFLAFANQNELLDLNLISYFNSLISQNIQKHHNPQVSEENLRENKKHHYWGIFLLFLLLIVPFILMMVIALFSK